MTPPELGFLMLTSHLGDPNRNPLTAPQLERVYAAVRLSGRTEGEGDVTPEILAELGLPQTLTERIPALLSQESQAKAYLEQAERFGLRCITRKSPDYPRAIAQRMGSRAPGVLWAGGNTSLLALPCIGVVGSRDLRPRNRAFAEAAGKAIAQQGYCLVSGNAIGADQAAQEAAFAAEGTVISVLPDAISAHCPPRKNQLYLWEDSYDLPFSAPRALSRNHIIHAMGKKVLVAQVSDGSGGTWNGTIQNLLQGYSPVFVFEDGSHGAELLASRGAGLISTDALADLRALTPDQGSIF